MPTYAITFSHPKNIGMLKQASVALEADPNLLFKEATTGIAAMFCKDMMLSANMTEPTAIRFLE
jgi:hypothetical protein